MRRTLYPAELRRHGGEDGSPRSRWNLAMTAGPALPVSAILTQTAGKRKRDLGTAGVLRLGTAGVLRRAETAAPCARHTTWKM